jgi:hypothetical protein
MIPLSNGIARRIEIAIDLPTTVLSPFALTNIAREGQSQDRVLPEIGVPGNQ